MFQTWPGSKLCFKNNAILTMEDNVVGTVSQRERGYYIDLTLSPGVLIALETGW